MTTPLALTEKEGEEDAFAKLLPMIVPNVTREAAVNAPEEEIVNVGELVAFAYVVAMADVATKPPAALMDAFEPVQPVLLRAPVKVPVVAPVKELDKTSAPAALILHVGELLACARVGTMIEVALPI